MHANARTAVVWGGPAVLLAAVAWAVSFQAPPKADFTFVNNADIKSVDPAVVIGQPEGRVISALFEGLTNWHPRTLEPEPGVAERWEISSDFRTYTFHLRADARWSDGSAVTAHDFYWSFRRVLDPMTASEYSELLWPVRGAKKYNVGDVEPGDKVEVELLDRPQGAPPFARGQVLKGRVVAVERPPGKTKKDVPGVYVVEVDGRSRRFSSQRAADVELCKQVLLDFDEVGLRAIDERTLRIELDNPTPFFMTLTGFYPLSPTPRHAIERHGYPEWCKPENFVSNGPFRLHSRRVRDRVRLVRSETYWGRAEVRVGTIDVLAAEALTTALNLYLSGQADWIPNVPTTVAADLLAQKRDDFSPSPEMTIYFYRLNTKEPPLDNPLVRKALALALDKREIVSTITRAGEVPARNLVPPGMAGYKPAQCGDYDPAVARRLLDEAGYRDRRKLPKLTILYNTDEGHQLIAELIQDQWKRNLGIDVEPQNKEWGAYLASQRLMEYQVSRAGWVADYKDPNTFLHMFIGGGAHNRTGWKNERYDALLEEAGREADPARRLELFHQAEAILMDELPIIPIYFRVSKNMVRPHVKGFFANPLDHHPLRAISIDRTASP